ncbi:MAG TPA: hypothetical protein VK611_03310 [Acidimicrobiales bacterium]|nr:hypothetical protein [Acidimicrobiales bacterium]
MDVRRVHGLLRAVRALRRGEGTRAKQHTASLPAELTDLLGLPLADVCATLAARVRADTSDLRAAEACVRFYGLGRLPEGIDAIAATMPRVHGDVGRPLRARRVGELLVEAEAALAAALGRAGLRVDPVAVAVPDVEEVFAAGAGADATDAGALDRLRVMLTAWADVPDEDHESAAALLLFEHDHGLRVADLVVHPETRRRRRRRAQAIVEVAVQRRCRGHDRRSSPIVDPNVDGLLGPRLHVADAGVWAALDHVCRLPDGDGHDREALVDAAAYAHTLAQAGSPHAPAVLGAVRHAVLTSPVPLPVGLVTRPLVSSAVYARLNDDPAGVPAAWEAIRLTRLALAGAAQPADAPQVTSNALRAFQELAELYGRLGLPHRAMTTLAHAYELLRARGDPEQEEEPGGWLQQLLFSQGMIQGHAARAAPHSAPGANARRWMAQAQAAEIRSAELVWEQPLLPPEWGLSAEAILAGLVVQEVEAHVAEGDGSAAARARARARRLIAGNEAGWRGHGAPGIAMAQSARLRTVRAACRLALVDGDLDGYVAERSRLPTSGGPGLLAEDADDLADLETTAARRGIRPLHLAGPSRHRTARTARTA